MALEAAQAGAVAQGCVGAGAGTMAFGLKGGIGTSSRVLPAGYVLGALVQSNFGGILSPLLLGGAGGGYASGQTANGSGSIIIVLATNAPLSDRNLKRVARGGRLRAWRERGHRLATALAITPLPSRSRRKFGALPTPNPSR